MKPSLVTAFLFVAFGQFSADPQATPQQEPGDTIALYRPQAHDLYNGRFNIEGKKIYQVGGLYDSAPWDHMGNDGKNVQAVGGSVEIDVNEIENTGRVRARLRLPEGSFGLSHRSVPRVHAVPRRVVSRPISMSMVTPGAAIRTGRRRSGISPDGATAKRLSTALLYMKTTRCISW